MTMLTSAQLKTKWKPYPACKDSGVEWLGQIPARWTIKKLKYLCHRSALYGANEPTSAYKDDGVRFLRTTDITEGGQLTADGAVFVEPSVIADYLLDDGDILISRSGTLGRCLVYSRAKHGPCAYAGYLVRFVPTSNLVPQFAFYLTKTVQFSDWLSFSAIESTIGNINGQKYANIPVPIPLAEEQRTISAFLDRETAKIDVLVAKKERLIELLQEKRAALITHAVTKGLDPTVPTKDSGVEWLGKVPGHWDVKKGRYLGELISSPHIHLTELGPDGTALFVKVDDLNLPGDGLYLDQSLEHVDAPRLTVIAFTGEIILFPKRGAAIFTNKVRISRRPVLFDSNIMGWKIAAGISVRYVAYALLARGLADLADVSSVPQINNKHIYPTFFPVPPAQERKSIVDFVEQETSKIDNLIAKVRAGIEKLKEYRTALISAAVTGKIDLRGTLADSGKVKATSVNTAK